MSGTWRLWARSGVWALQVALLLAPAGASAQLLELLTPADAPIFVTHAGDDRLFVVERQGEVRVFEGGVLLPTPLLDLGDAVDTTGEGGLFSVAFHPEHSSNGLFYVSYTSDLPGTGFTSVVSRFRVGADPNVAEPAEDVLLTLPQPGLNHNGGQLQFGPDGYLYVAFGDGIAGIANEPDPDCASQRTDTLLGKILRLDVDQSVGEAPFYGIPPDNPYAAPDDGVRDEIWDTGLRNPWRFSFDRTRGDLWIADVGKGAREEVDREAPNSLGGTNWGWKAMEGTTCRNPDRIGCPAWVPPCGDPLYEPPVFEYPHASTNGSITGGYVYRGSRTPGFVGAYLFGDFLSGRIWSIHHVGGGQWQQTELHGGGNRWSSFGEGADGELYAADIAGDGVYHLDLDAVPALDPAPVPLPPDPDPPGPPPPPGGGAQRRCVSGLNGSFAKVSKAEARKLARCVKQGARGRLPGTIEACAAAEAAKVARQRERASEVEARECTETARFGPTDAGVVTAAAAAAEAALLHDLLGPDLDAAVADRSVQPDVARCQGAVVKRLQRCQAARFGEFNRCKKRGLKASEIRDAADLDACQDDDARGKVARKCDALEGGVVRALSKCGAVDLAGAFPGCGEADPAGAAACAERAGRCRACRALSEADELGSDCDVFDDAVANGSCGGSPAS